MGYLDLRFDKDSTFLVTGAAGFIGSNLCEALTDMGYQVRSLDDLSTGKEENIQMFLERPNYTFIKGDIKNLDTCMEACKGASFLFGNACPAFCMCYGFCQECNVSTEIPHCLKAFKIGFHIFCGETMNLIPVGA